MIANEIRKRFLDFFASREHKIIASDSLVPKNDPTVLFTSAGMNQFKKQFLGHITDFRRAATCQKCLRTDDLEKVGKTPFHHTFFEMLGNFSFGDYFKEEAILWAWEFLTKELKIPAEKLWVSVYIEDNETLKIWQDKIKIPAERILALSDKDNFWPAQARTKGPNGPCGPCSEIFFDYGIACKNGKPGCNPTCACGRFTEVWNLVFTQFERKEGGILAPLPNKNIDTGMGLERLSAVMEGVTSNFDTDLFKPIIEAIKKEAALLGGEFSLEDNDFAVKALADHIRAIVFAISDGVLPSNEERGYVIRKLIRRCCSIYRQANIHKPFIYKIVAVVAEVMKEPYPQILNKRESITGVVKKEEEAFSQLLMEYLPLVETEIKKIEKEFAHKKAELAQEVAKLKFKAYDTFGLPAEITDEIALKLKITMDNNLFEELMNQQKNRSRQASSMLGDVFSDSEIKVNLPATVFLGYELWESESKMLKIFKDNKETGQIEKGDTAKVILDKTPFYAESGGQIGDTGTIIKEKNKIEVLDTQAIEKNIIHIVKVIEGQFKAGDLVIASVNKDRRLSIARNHTATHLLQTALRKVLGEHVQQQGSLVAEDRLRFDFTHFKALEKNELDRIEEVVNEFILGNAALDTQVMPIEKAKQSGALAFFAEKYDEMVRVLKIGSFSQEFCGGTHLSQTGEIGLFKIISESSIAQGIRRIEAVTGISAYKLVKQKEEILDGISQILKSETNELVSRVEKQINCIKELEKKVTSLKLKAFNNSIEGIIKKSAEYSGIKIVVEKIEDADNELLRQMIDLLKLKLNSSIITLASIYENKAFMAVGVTENLVKNGINAVAIINDISVLFSAKGGGRPSLASAGSANTSQLSGALAKAPEIIMGKIK